MKYLVKVCTDLLSEAWQSDRIVEFNATDDHCDAKFKINGMKLVVNKVVNKYGLNFMGWTCSQVVLP